MDYKSLVSILVLMNTWVKTTYFDFLAVLIFSFNPCFNGYMGKDNKSAKDDNVVATVFQSLF